ncbi:unnamed protein product [Didymodactylos carnosus]|uniref:Uncharacterized protein n=1 Tax=Didymodactylos carnosus TaxID=1234261 RepID=A0A8S2K803_9BILA|nr:unnamed protein product [Didymodactylos carnosus]CAF3841257.1 unnamed protein product [Didymodactylos carnosus]
MIQSCIYLDNRDIRNLNIEWLRSQIGYVGQEPILFAGSIQENIRLGKPDATNEEIQAAAKMANAHDFITKLADGYNTESKGRLSGGQKQRIAIARAIISDPRILLLDEATSALDSRSEKVVQDALDKAKEGRTTVVIAHRLTTIRDADIIFMFDQGKIVEQGTHNELVRQEGLYYQLASQKAAEEEEQPENEQPETINREANLTPRRMSSIELEENDEDENLNNVVVQESSVSEAPRAFFRRPFSYKLLKLNSPEKWYLLTGSICALLFGAVEPAVGLVYSVVYGLLANSNLEEQSTQTRNLSLSIFGIYVCAGVLQFLSTVTFTKAGEELTMRMRLMTFAAILRKEMGWFDKDSNSVGSLITRLSSDTSALKGLTGVRLGVLLQSLGAVIAAFVIAFQAGWKLTFVVLCFTPLLILSGYLQGRTQTRAGHSKTAKSFAEEGGRYAVEAIQGIRTVATLNRQKFFIKKYEDNFNNDFSVGRSTSAMPAYAKAKAAALRIMQLKNHRSEIDPDDGSGLKPTKVNGCIEFRNVDFEYPARRKIQILKNFSLICPQNQTTALVGSSGSGKSTAIALLLRFYDPSKGEVYLDGYKLKSLNVQWLRSVIGFVQQEPLLFGGTVRENIAYGDNSREVPFEEIQEAAKRANIHSRILKLPKGYDTPCGTTGDTQLAGGEKQRVAIARALVGNRKILLLDEATSALDNRSQQIVQEAIDEARADRTCVTIAHRLTAIQNSEKIVVVERGQPREEGTHDALLRRRGYYYRLHRATQHQGTNE